MQACKFCGRGLKSPKALQRGFGPVCAKKHGLLPIERLHKEEETVNVDWTPYL